MDVLSQGPGLASVQDHSPDEILVFLEGGFEGLDP